ncbi:hypothetical protein [Methylomagnum sp.]
MFSGFDKINKASVTDRLAEIEESADPPGNAKPQLGEKSESTGLGLGAPTGGRPGNAKPQLGDELESTELGLGVPGGGGPGGSVPDEVEVLREWLRLSNEAAGLKKRLKEAEAAGGGAGCRRSWGDGPD